MSFIQRRPNTTLKDDYSEGSAHLQDLSRFSVFLFFNAQTSLHPRHTYSHNTGARKYTSFSLLGAVGSHSVRYVKLGSLDGSFHGLSFYFLFLPVFCNRNTHSVVLLSRIALAQCGITMSVFCSWIAEPARPSGAGQASLVVSDEYRERGLMCVLGLWVRKKKKQITIWW